ncbi:MAG TPA: hypothetical protein VHB98_24100 [Chloroflexota bacterium]|jgi:hypothetical protein|nr:hypothetical protein [Chloroflexota bacterium]
MSDSNARDSKLTTNGQPVFPPANAGEEPTDSNPVPLSPTQPEHRTSDGAQEPQTGPAVFAVPAGNQAGVGSGGGAAGIAGIGAIVTPDDPQKRVSHEQPGKDSANPLPSSLDREALSKPVDR